MKKLFAMMLFIGGCATLTPQGSTVRVVRDIRIAGDCKYITPVSSSSSWGGLASGLAFDNAMNELKNKTAESGGNTVLMSESLSSWGGTRMVGDAYLCTR